MVKSAQPGEGGGCTPFIFHSIYHHEQSCVVPVCSSWEGRYTPAISPPPFSPLCCWPSLRGYWHMTVWYWISLVARKSLRICPIWRRGRARDIPDERKMKKNSNVVIPKMKVCFPKTKSTTTFLKQNKQILSIFCFKKHWMQIRISKVWTEFKICIKEKRGTQIFINVMQIRNTAFPKNIVTLMSWVRYRKRI
jgi:hypothetical protein